MNRAAIAVVVVVILVGGILVLGRSSGDPGTVPPGTPGTPDKPVNQDGKKVQIERPVKVVIECEAYVRIEDKEPGGRIILQKGSSTEGSEIVFLETPDGWMKECGFGAQEKVGGAIPGKAFYEFDLPRDGTYHLFLRAQWYDNCGDSAYVRIDDGDYYRIEDTEGRVSEVSYMWAWHPLRQQGRMQALELKAGKHKLELNVREDGPKFDKFLIGTDATPPAHDTANP